LIHGLWNTSSIFSSVTSKLDEIGIEYFAPTLKHSYGMTSILDLTNKLNELILEKYGLEKEIDILGFSMGGIIGRHLLQKFYGYNFLIASFCSCFFISSASKTGQVF